VDARLVKSASKPLSNAGIGKEREKRNILYAPVLKAQFVDSLIKSKVSFDLHDNRTTEFS
jgi:hypothetical protein